LNFPVGYERFHKKQHFNFQLNRWYSWGYLRKEDMQEAGRRIRDFESWITVLSELAERALGKGRLLEAAFLYRAAEFYTLKGDPDKEVLYDRFIDLFYKAVSEDDLTRQQVPYRDSHLPLLRIPRRSDSAKTPIVIFGGMDSLIEEFYLMMRFFSMRGFDVIGFEGPGQGAALRKNGLPLEYEWEKPLAAVLDHCQLDNVTILGISMGGWLCFRASAFEPRVERVIASSIAYDYGKIAPGWAQKMMTWFFRYLPEFTNRSTLRKIKKGGQEAWAISNLMFITGKDRPIDCFNTFFQLNEENLHSDKVTQDVLILTGKDDHFIPFKMHEMQVKALTNARSVTSRVFTREDQAQNHCQVGNLGLALESMVDWIEGRVRHDERSRNINPY